MIKMGIVTGTLAVLVSSSVAEAARCPSGQIYRVSKKVCQSKAIAVKLGIKINKRKKATRKKAAAPRRAGNNALVTGKKPVLRPTSAANLASETQPTGNPEAIQQNAGAAKFRAIGAPNGLAAIGAATSTGGAAPITTRFVKPTYFNPTADQRATDIKDNAVMKRAVLGLLRTRLEVHAERNRHLYIERTQ